MMSTKKYTFQFDDEMKTQQAHMNLEDAGNKFIEIPLGKLKHFCRHPFKISSERVKQLSRDIQENGLISAIIVREKLPNEEYEILAGHHRFEATKLAGSATIRAEVLKNISEEEAEIIVTNSNFYQRSAAEMLPSELAKACSMFYEASRKQGKRFELSSNELSRQVGEAYKLSDARKISSAKFGISPRTLDRNVRLAKLGDEFLELLDNDKIPSSAGVEISFLPKIEQEILWQWLSKNRANEKVWLSIKEAEIIHKNFEHDLQDCSFCNEGLDRLLLKNEEGYTSKKQSKHFKLKRTDFDNYFDTCMSEEEIAEEIKEALEFYRTSKVREELN